MLFILTSIAFVKQLIKLPDTYPHVGLLAYPVPLLWAFAAWVGTGGLLIFVGLLLVGPYLRIGRGLEKAGLWLALTSWSTIALVDAWQSPSVVLEWGTYLTLVVGCSLRLYALHKIEHAVQVATDTDAPENGLDSER